MSYSEIAFIVVIVSNEPKTLLSGSYNKSKMKFWMKLQRDSYQE